MRLLVAIACVIIWVAGATLVTAYALSFSMVDGRIPVEVLQWTIWPYVVLVAVGVGGISLISAGPAAVRELARLRSSMDKIPEQIGRLQDLQKATADVAGLMSQTVEQVQKATDAAKRAAEEAAAAAGRTDEASQQMADVSVQAEMKPLADQLLAHYFFARDRYWEVAESYEKASHQEVKRTQGYLNREMVEDARKLGTVAEAKARYLSRVLEVEANTRRGGRRNLTTALVAELDSLRVQAGW